MTIINTMVNVVLRKNRKLRVELQQDVIEDKPILNWFIK